MAGIAAAFNAVAKAPAKAPAPAPVAATNPLLNPGQPLSGNALLQAAQGLVNAQTQGPLTELARQIAQNNQQTAGAQNLTGGYFDQLGKQAQSGVDQTGRIASGLNDTLAGIGNDTQSQLRGIGDNAMSGLSKYTPQGPQGGLNDSALHSLTQEIARQQGLAAQNAGTFRAYGATQGANLNGLAASNLGTFALKGQEALKGIAQAGQVRNEPLESKVANLDASKGALLSNAIGKLRQQEIANQISKAGLLTKEQIAALNAQTSTNNNIRTTDTSAANNAATNATSTANNIRTTNTSAANNAANNAIRVALQNQKLAAAGGTVKPLSTAGQLTQYQVLDKLPSIIDTLRTPINAAQAKKLGQPVGWVMPDSQIKTLLAAKYGATYAQVAFEMKGWGHITPGTASKLYQLGLRGPHFKVAPAPLPQPTATQGIGGAVTGVGQALGGALR